MKTMYLIFLLFVLLLVLFVGLNYRQLYSAWAIRSEKSRLVALAANTSDERAPSPTSMADCFDGRLCPHFWKFGIINGNGKVSKESAWHAVAMTLENGLTISHFFDTEFESESAKMHTPAADRYNNLSLISKSSFRPTPSSDVVLKFSTQVSDNFYGTAGVIFQPVGTLGEDGLFMKPFDMFGFSIVGRESTIMGINGPLCYLALNWMPVKVNPLHVDTDIAHAYEIRLRWASQTEWLGSLKVDDTEMCEMLMPSFGSAEIHVWSDNFHVVSTPRRWWEIAPAMDLKFLNGGEKQFQLETIQISEEAR